MCPPDRFFRGWNRWNDRFSCCGSLFGTNPAQAGGKAEEADLERVSIKSNRGYEKDVEKTQGDGFCFSGIGHVSDANSPCGTGSGHAGTRR